MKRFRYVFDPLCLSACVLYAVNRFLVKPHVGPGFFHSHFNDLLVIPAALPFLLWANRRLGWRRDDRPPTWREVVAHTFLWAVICEGVGPRIFPRYGVADWKDVAAYMIGAVAAWAFWNRVLLSKRARVMTEATL
jgi:hypothetical protein